jgi:DNA recombination protein RmuC
MDAIVLITVGILAAALGVVIGRYVWPSVRPKDRDALAFAQTEVARLSQESIALRGRSDQLDAERKFAVDEVKTAGQEVARLTERVAGLTKQAEEQTKHATLLENQRKASADEGKASGAEAARLNERVASLANQAEEQRSQIVALETQRDAAANEAKVAGAEVARLGERETALSHKIEGLTAQLSDQQKQLTVEFENIANRILKSNATELSTNSQKELSAVLEPLRQRIQDFQTKVEATYTAENREVLSLKEQIKLIVETSNAIGNQADGLAKALRNEPQALGRWGELALERILEAAGLTHGREYISQGRGLGLRSESGGSQRPDIIVKLPEQRTMIIDSKVPLASYERLIAANDEASRNISADEFVSEMKGHIDDLAGKRYQENETLQAHDYILMFIPIEGALAAALTREPELFVYAWNQKVVIVGPPTLLMTMKTVASIWRYEDQGQNAQDIARLAGDLCDKVSASLNDLNETTEKITAALSTHHEAVKRLASGRGNALSIGQRIRNLGVKTKKPMPSMLVEGVSLTAPSDDFQDDVPPETDPEP